MSYLVQISVIHNISQNIMQIKYQKKILLHISFLVPTFAV